MVVVVVDVPQKTCSLQIRDMRWCGVLVFSQLIQKRCVNEYVIQYAGVSNQLKYSCVDVEYWLDFLYSFHRWVPTPLGSYTVVCFNIAFVSKVDVSSICLSSFLIPLFLHE